MIVPPDKEARLKVMYLISHAMPFEFDGTEVKYESLAEAVAYERPDRTATGRVLLNVHTGIRLYECIEVDTGEIQWVKGGKK